MSPAAPRTTLSLVLRLTAEGEAMLSRGTVGGWLVTVAALAIALAAPAGAATEGVVGVCPPSAYEQPFAPWLDFASYVLAPNGGLESGAAGWSLDGGAAVVAGNESFYVRGGPELAAYAAGRLPDEFHRASARHGRDDERGLPLHAAGELERLEDR